MRDTWNLTFDDSDFILQDPSERFWRAPDGLDEGGTGVATHDDGFEDGVRAADPAVGWSAVELLADVELA